MVSKIGPNNLRLRPSMWKNPTRRAKDVAEGALEVGAQLVRGWANPWGLSVAVAFPEAWTAWFIVDDFRHGKFASIGVRIIDGIGFGAPVRIFDDNYAQAASYALSYGIPKYMQDAIENALRKDYYFPINKKTRRLWGRGTDAFKDQYLTDALYELQSFLGVDPTTVIAATKTVEIAYE